MKEAVHATTVLCVSRNGETVMASDGQVTVGTNIMKTGAKKVRQMGEGKALAGFAGAVADAFALFEKFEGKLSEFNCNLPRAAMEFARQWRTDKYLQRLEAMLLVADRERMLVISGGGEVIEPDEPVAAIGSGGPQALAAARALLSRTDLSAEEIVREAMGIAASICIYTNDRLTVEKLTSRA